MRKALRLILLGVALNLVCVTAAHAQPAARQQQPVPEPDARCREAALRSVHPSPDKEHLTVEAEEDYEYRQNKKYLRLCGDSDDALTRSIKAVVLGREAGPALAALRMPGSREAKDPNTYGLIAAAWELRYNALLDTMRRSSASPSVAESLVKQADDLADQLVDAYARALALCAQGAACAPSKKAAWTEKLTELYKSRHGDSDAGLEEFIRGALDRPFPNP
jgi:hypothetical protein